jgi:hypothetical protein
MSLPWEHLTLSHSRPPVSREVIKSVSASIGLPFPPLYVDFLLAHNGGMVQPLCPIPRRFPIQGCKRDTHGFVHVFFNVGTGDAIDLAREYKVFRDRVPAGLLPIGSDPGGNLICLACKGKRKGQVFFWERAFEADEDEDEEVGWDNVYFISGSLEEFFRGLEVDEEDAPTDSGGG